MIYLGRRSRRSYGINIHGKDREIVTRKPWLMVAPMVATPPPLPDKRSDKSNV